MAIARSLNPIPSRTRPLNSSAPMVLCLKTRESRSLPGLQRTNRANALSRIPSRSTLCRPQAVQTKRPSVHPEGRFVLTRRRFEPMQCSRLKPVVGPGRDIQCLQKRPCALPPAQPLHPLGANNPPTLQSRKPPANRNRERKGGFARKIRGMGTRDLPENRQIPRKYRKPMLRGGTLAR